MYYFIYYFALFMVYSFCGWIIETIYVGISERKIVNRGFLLGPYLPIYGVAGTLMTFILGFYIDYPLFLFLNSIIIGSIVEYFTGYAMEKIFKAKWWDYSNIPLNLNGRICLQNSILFGILGTILVYYINPFLHSCLNRIPNSILYFISGLLLSLFIIDTIISCNIIRQLKLTASALKKDYTDEMSHKVRESLANKNWSFKRVLNAFPNLTFLNMKQIKKMIKKQAKMLKDKTKKLARLRKQEEKLKDKQREIENEIKKIK
ncbi:MAG: putative ABC transporter permease [Bacilli bacterium]|jgi:uncharacterized membrane protein|nr:putative ABC transporter permease [Bacilli bacterium]